MRQVVAIPALVIMALLLAVRTSCMKVVAFNASEVWGLWGQSLVSVMVLLPIIAYDGKWRTTQPLFEVIRGLSDMVFMLAAYSLLLFLPTVHVTMMATWAPQFTPLVLWAWSREPIKGRQLVIGFIGLIGLGAICCDPVVGMGRLVTLGGLTGLFGAVTLITIPRLRRTDGLSLMLLWTHAVPLIVLIPFLFFSHPLLNLGDWVLVVCIGITSLIIEGIFLFCLASKETSRYLPLTFLAIVFSGVYDYYSFDYIPSLLLLIGAVCTLFASSCVMLRPPKNALA